MNLLPENYVRRSQKRARSSRLAIVIIASLIALVAFSTHSRIAVNQSSEQLLIHQAHANEAIKLEVNATDLELEKAQLKLQNINRKTRSSILVMSLQPLPICSQNH